MLNLSPTEGAGAVWIWRRGRLTDDASD